MPMLQVTPLREQPETQVTALDRYPSIEDEIDAMVAAVVEFDATEPDVIMSVSMALMGRCTEIYLQLVRIEHTSRKAKALRTMQLQKVMDLLDFQFKGASRLIEVRKQEIELTRS